MSGASLLNESMKNGLTVLELHLGKEEEHKLRGRCQMTRVHMDDMDSVRGLSFGLIFTKHCLRYVSSPSARRSLMRSVVRLLEDDACFIVIDIFRKTGPHPPMVIRDLDVLYHKLGVPFLHTCVDWMAAMPASVKLKETKSLDDWASGNGNGGLDELDSGFVSTVLMRLHQSDAIEYNAMVFSL